MKTAVIGGGKHAVGQVCPAEMLLACISPTARKWRELNKCTHTLPRAREALPAVPASVEIENGVSICQHSRVDSPSDALNALMLRLRPYATLAVASAATSSVDSDGYDAIMSRNWRFRSCKRWIRASILKKIWFKSRDREAASSARCKQ